MLYGRLSGSENDIKSCRQRDEQYHSKLASLTQDAFLRVSVSKRSLSATRIEVVSDLPIHLAAGPVGNVDHPRRVIISAINVHFGPAQDHFGMKSVWFSDDFKFSFLSTEKWNWKSGVRCFHLKPNAS